MVTTSHNIRDGLTALGVRPGMRLMVHSSLRSLGRVQGGAHTVISALMEAVGSQGTLLMPSFNHGAPFREDGQGFFDPKTTPTTNGAVPDRFWRMPGVHRSLNPTHAFAAWGKDAERYVARHHLTLTMGEDSPLGLLAREGGFQLNLGTTHHTTTAKHLAETIRRVPCLGYRTEAYPVRLPDRGVAEHRTWSWRQRACPLTDAGVFIEAEMQRLALQKKGRVGASLATFFRVNDLLHAVWRLLDCGYAGYPPCAQCSIRPLRTSHTRPSDWPHAQSST